MVKTGAATAKITDLRKKRNKNEKSVRKAVEAALKSVGAKVPSKDVPVDPWNNNFKYHYLKGYNETTEKRKKYQVRDIKQKDRPGLYEHLRNVALNYMDWFVKTQKDVKPNKYDMLNLAMMTTRLSVRQLLPKDVAKDLDELSENEDEIQGLFY